MLDAHCHIDLYEDPHRIVREMERRKVTIIAVTNLPDHFELGYAHVQGLRHIRLALGLHPLLADRHNKAQMRKFERLLRKTSFIGEVGLDRSREGMNTYKKQVDSFRFVLGAIKDQPRFVTLHSRGAESAVLQLLSEYGLTGCVFHWYSGPATLVDEIVDAGHYLSVNPAMTKSARGRKIIESVAQEHVLTETDGPYLRVGTRPAEPSDVAHVVEFLARAWNVSSKVAEKQVHSNFSRALAPLRQWSKTSAL
jgi:TatD DNase family protein